MRGTNDRTPRRVRSGIIAAACVLAAATAANAIAKLAQAPPQVGDILAFAAMKDGPAERGARLLVRRQDQFECILDLATLHHSGGSLIVESQLGDDAGRFRLHWAGPRTSADVGNCGRDAELIVDQRDLDTLALAAGGNVAGGKSSLSFARDIDNQY